MMEKSNGLPLEEKCSGAHFQPKIAVKTDDGGYLHISGNPTKLIQGHNAFGTNDLFGLNHEFFSRAVAILNLNPSDIERQKWKNGDYLITRIDLA